MLAKRDDFYLTAKITILLVRVWPIYDVIYEQRYMRMQCSFLCVFNVHPLIPLLLHLNCCLVHDAHDGMWTGLRRR